MSEEKAKAPTREEQLRSRLAAATETRKQLADARALNDLEREVTDAEALAKLEQTYPDGFAIVYLNAPLTGCPGFVAASDCSNDQFKRHQSQSKVRVVGGAAEVGDSTERTAQLGRVNRIFPDEKKFQEMCAARAGLESGLGQEVLSRAQTRKAEDAKK